MNTLSAAQLHRDYLSALRRHFHSHPELSGREEETCARIRRELDSLGIPWVPVAGLGTVAVLEGRPGAPVIGLRADMDALPIQEENRADYASRNPGVMHACGHDAHMAILLGAARLLRDLGPALEATVKLIFQPSEETASGAKYMAGDPVLADLDNVAAIHVWSGIPVGQISAQTGSCMASVDNLELVVKGQSAHGSQPQDGVDALYVAAMVENAVQAVVSRMTSPFDPAVVTMGTFQAGSAPNIIASRAELQGTVRTFREELRREIPRRVEHILKHVALAFGAEWEFRHIPCTPVTVNEPRSAELARRAAAEVVGTEGVTAYGPISAGEDFAYFLERTPGAMVFVGCGNAAEGKDHPHHNCRFDIDERALEIGAAFFASFVLQVQKTHGKGSR